MSAGIAIPLIIMFILLQGFFSGSEMAMVKANKAGLRARAEDGDHRAALALDLVQNRSEQLLGTCLIGTNLCLISGTTLAALLFHSNGLTSELLQVAIYTPVVLTFGEALPKELYRHHADSIAPRVARPLDWIMRFPMRPLVALVGLWERLLSRIAAAEEETIKREDIVSLVEEGDRLDPDDQRFIQRYLATRETTVGTVMTPLVDLAAVPVTATVADTIALVLHRGHSRLPVYRDRIDHIVGLVNHRILLATQNDSAIADSIKIPVPFVPETKRVDSMIQEMLQTGNSLCIVVDEYGGSVGLVTLEDCFEEVVGEIADERDRNMPIIRFLGNNIWRVPARCEVEDLQEVIGPLPDGDYETVAGLVLSAAGRIPGSGEDIRIGEFLFTVEAASDRAIHLLRVARVPNTSAVED